MGCTTDVGLLSMVRLVAILGGMVVRRVAEGLSLMAPEKHDWNGSSRRTEPTSAGRVGFSGAFGTFRAGHGGHGLSGGGREVAAAQAEVVRRILLVSFCQVSSGVVPSKGHRGRQVSARRRHCWPRWISVVFALRIVGR